MDKILIRDLVVTTVVGTRPEERVTPRQVSFDLELFLDLAPAGTSDDLRKSVNYQEVAERLAALGRDSAFLLIETLAERAAKLILDEFPAVTAVKSATSILKTGDTVIVDGSKGEVTILEGTE